MYSAISASDDVQTYLQYTAAPYNLGWSLRQESSLHVPAYAGPLDLTFARVPPAS